MPMITISNWWCARCRRLVSSEDVLSGRHCPKDPNAPRCKGEVEFRTVWLESAQLEQAFNNLDEQGEAQRAVVKG